MWPTEIEYFYIRNKVKRGNPSERAVTEIRETIACLYSVFPMKRVLMCGVYTEHLFVSLFILHFKFMIFPLSIQIKMNNRESPNPWFLPHLKPCSFSFPLFQQASCLPPLIAEVLLAGHLESMRSTSPFLLFICILITAHR